MMNEYQHLANVLDDGLSTELMNAGRLCFNCEQIFSSRRCLEEHHCPVPSFICSCGSEFMSYQGMLQHNKSHEPGYQVLCHETIKKRRIEKHWEEEEKLQRLQSGEVIWEGPKPSSVKAATQIPTSSKMPQNKPQPQMLPRPSPNMHQNIATPSAGKLFSNIGAPTVDLWTLFQPVVEVKSMQSSPKTHIYTCGKCGQSFATRRSLVIHHNAHIADKVCGCIGCGLLLSSRKIVPRFHSCNSSHVYKFKLITARPLNNISANIANSLAKIASSTQSLKTQNGSYNKMGDVLGINYNLSNTKKPFIPVQSKPVISNPKLPTVNSPPATQTAPGVVSPVPGKGYECRVCHVYFESINVLQRHKCAKAHEFLLKHKLAAPVNRQRQVVPVKISPTPVQNSVSNPLQPVPAPTGNSKVSNVNNKESATVVSDDDCFIVESGPEKPAEVIYQVTSSVPIQT